MLDIEDSFMAAMTNDYRILDKARSAVWECAEFSFNEKVEIDDLLQKGVDVILKVPLNTVRLWYLLKIQQYVNDLDGSWFLEQIKNM